MRCLICGEQIKEGVICDTCTGKVTEDLCYEVAQYNYKEPDNDLWADIISQLDSPYSFRTLSFDLAEFVKPTRVVFVKIQCMNLANSNDLGVAKRNRSYVLEHLSECMENEYLTLEEKNLVQALTLEGYISNYEWDKIGDLQSKLQPDDSFVETTLVLAHYYSVIRDYVKSLDYLKGAKAKFKDQDVQQRIDRFIQDYEGRKNHEKKEWTPAKRDDMEVFYRYLDGLGVEHNQMSNDKRGKIKESDFKPYVRYEEGDIPVNYIAVWITFGKSKKLLEAVEINAVKVINGTIEDRFHSFVKPVDKPQKPASVKEDDYMKALPIDKVFPEFIKFTNNEILAIAGFDEQKKVLSRLARYSYMDHIDNKIFDVIEYEEDMSEDFDSYSRETIMKKYGVEDGESGMGKAEATVELIENMR